MPLLSILPMLVVIGAMIWGFSLAGRWAKTVPMQMLLGLLLGLLLGFGIMFGVMCVLFGVMFAGCLIMGSPSFH